VSGLIATGGGNITSVSQFISRKDSSSAAGDREQTHGPSPAGTSTSGVGGLFLATSSGGQQPTYTTEIDPVTGEVKGYITMILDETSFPRASDLKGIAFSIVVNPAVVQFASNNVAVDKAAGRATVTIARTGDKSGSMTVDYATGNGTANDRSDYSPIFGSVTFAPEETSKDVTIPLINHGYGSSDFGARRSFNLIIVNAVGGAIQAPNFATINITNNQVSNSTTNPLDNSDARFFVREQYLDFLGREPDQSGWDFWSNNITACGVDAACLEVKRIDTSAAYFLSLEFQGTGFLVHRIYNAAMNRANGLPRYVEFVRDRQQIGRGVVVNQGNWEQQLETNKQVFLSEFVTRREFLDLYPVSLSPAEYVDALYAHAGITPSATERQAAVDEFNNTDGGARGRVLRSVAESTTLSQREFNRSFVLMQFFGYLRRNPDDAPDGNLDGFNFWLNKLNSFGGDYRRAEMVKAFIVSSEYRKRFGQN
jgi:hypothetical protein